MHSLNDSSKSIERKVGEAMNQKNDSSLAGAGALLRSDTDILWKEKMYKAQAVQEECFLLLS